MKKYFLKKYFPALFYKLTGMNNHSSLEDSFFLELIEGLYRDDRTLQHPSELYNLYYWLKRTKKIEGDIAEVGVFRGGTARLFATLESVKMIHLFDTFQGMPETNKLVDHHVAGDFDDTSLLDVRNYLCSYGNTRFYQGLFPDSASALPKDVRFSFVHLDVDIYESTYAALNFFVPRMCEGGCLISHDYNSRSCPGVKQAFNDFFQGNVESLVPLWKSSVLFVKGISL